MIEIKAYNKWEDIPLCDMLRFESIMKDAMKSYESRVEEYVEKYGRYPQDTSELAEFIKEKFFLTRAMPIYCYIDGVVVSGLMLDIQGKRATIYDFSTDLNMQGKGLGMKVLEATYHEAIKAGAKKLTLEVRDNSPAYFLYSKFGFKITQFVKNGMVKDDKADKFEQRGIAVTSKNSVKMEIDLTDEKALLLYRKLRNAKKGQFDFRWQELVDRLHYSYKDMYPNSSLYHASAVELSKADSIIDYNGDIYPLVIAKHGVRILSMPYIPSKDETVIDSLLKYEVVAEYPKSLIDARYNSMDICWAKAYSYEWDSLKDYFEVGGGSSKGTRWEQRQIVKKYKQVNKVVRLLSSAELLELEEFNVKWLELIKKNDKGAKESLQKSVKFLRNYRHEPVMGRSFVNLYYSEEGVLSAYSYVEVHGENAIIVENKSIIKEYSAFKYLTYEACKFAHLAGATDFNIGGAQEEVNPGTMKAKVVTSVGANMDEVKSSLPHKVYYTLLAFPKSKSLDEDTSKSYSLF
jgi:GNAT superfamily N-acetyltransferase